MALFGNKIRTYDLTRANIDRIADDISDYLTSKKYDRKEILKLKIIAENSLITWLEKFGEGRSVDVSIIRRIGSHSVKLECEGLKCDPLDEADDENLWVRTIADKVDQKPVYDYFARTNTLYLPIRRESYNRLVFTLIFIVLGIIIGNAGYMLPEETRQAISADVFTPISNAYLTLFSFAGVPLIFLSVVCGIMGVGDLKSFSEIGKKLLKRFGLGTLICTAAAILIAIPYFSLSFGADALRLEYGSILGVVLGWIPSSPVSPFIELNAMQLVIMGAGFGIAMIAINRTEGKLAQVFLDLQSVLLTFCGWFAKIIPVFVCFTIINSIWQSGVPQLLSAWTSWVITVGGQMALVLILAGIVSYKYRVGFLTLLKKISKTFLISLGTNSCTVSVPENYNCCATKLGINPKVFSFGIPIGTTVFKPATAIRAVLLCFFMAKSLDMEISVMWLIYLAVMAIVVSVSVPAIPGGFLMLCPLLFRQMGFPESLLVQMLATDVFFDCFCTAANQVSVELELANESGNMGLIDQEVLTKTE